MKITAKNTNIIARNNVFALSGLAKAALKFGATKSHSVQERIGFMITSARTQPESLGWINDRILEVQNGADLIKVKPSMDEVTANKANLVMAPETVDEEQFQEYILSAPTQFYQSMYWFARKYNKYAYDADFHELLSKADVDKLTAEAMKADMQSIVEGWHERKQEQANTSGNIPEWLQDDVVSLTTDADSVSQFVDTFDLIEPAIVQAMNDTMRESHTALIAMQEAEKARLVEQGKDLASALFSDTTESTNDTAFKDTEVSELFA